MKIDVMLRTGLVLLATSAGCGGGGAIGDAGPSGADAIAGGGDAAAAADAPPGTTADPGLPGAAEVVSEDVAIPTSAGTVDATVFRPATGTDHPLVVVSPGFQMARAQYASYGEHLASWGMVAVVQDFPPGFGNPHDALAEQTIAVIDWALSPASGLAGTIDAARIATCGHSLGGKISMLAAADDPRIGAVVGWDPVDSNTPSVTPERMGDVAGAVAVLGETLDSAGGFMPCAPAADNFQQFYAAAAAPALEVTVNDADHMEWVDDTSCGLCGFCSPAGTLPSAAVHLVTRRVTVAWLRRHLLGDAAMDAYLAGAGLSAGLPAGAVSARSR